MQQLSRRQLIKLIKEELLKADPNEPRKTEMNEFSTSNPGKKVIKEGKRIMGAGKAINAIAHEQTGRMRETLNKISEFVWKTGLALSEIDSLKENESVANKLPSVTELKQLHKEIQRLEKL